MCVALHLKPASYSFDRDKHPLITVDDKWPLCEQPNSDTSEFSAQQTVNDPMEYFYVFPTSILLNENFVWKS